DSAPPSGGTRCRSRLADVELLIPTIVDPPAEESARIPVLAPAMKEWSPEQRRGVRRSRLSALDRAFVRTVTRSAAEERTRRRRDRRQSLRRPECQRKKNCQRVRYGRADRSAGSGRSVGSWFSWRRLPSRPQRGPRA